MKLKPIIYNLRQQPVIAAVSIIGTALAIFLIMVIVMMNEVKVAPFAPESNRDRWLINPYMSIGNTNWANEGTSNGPLGSQTIENVYLRMKTPELVTVFSINADPVSIETIDVAPSITDLRGTDVNFWKVMDFTFLSGKPYTEAEFQSEIPVAVLSESLARKLFKSEDAIGKEFSINLKPYKVCGVVKDVSTLAKSAYAQVWIPYTSSSYYKFGWCDDIMGPFSVIMLAKSRNDFPEIRQEFDMLHKAYFESLSAEGWTYHQLGRPYDQDVYSMVIAANIEPDVAGERNGRYMVFAVLLLVPAINLSSMTHSRLRRQRQDIGVRRAFGATKWRILSNIMTENLVITLIAGLIGLIASALFAALASNALFASEFTMLSATPIVEMRMLLNWHVFLWALLFCFVLNLLSAGIPALQASRTNIVNALSNK